MHLYKTFQELTAKYKQHTHNVNNSPPQGVSHADATPAWTNAGRAGE